jgi:hypothetical protein
MAPAMRKLMKRRRSNKQQIRALPVNPAGRETERPLRICIVFDDDASVRCAEALINHVASAYKCKAQSFSFEQLEAPAPGGAAARRACDADILVVALRDDRMLPQHVQFWLGLCISLQKEDKQSALVVLIAKAQEAADSESSLMEYLETVAVIGGLALFSRRPAGGEVLGQTDTSSPQRWVLGTDLGARNRFESLVSKRSRFTNN